jgi:cohesin loading factor subunit SCC2
MAFSDGLVIQTVYLALSPLFVNEPAGRKGKGKAGTGKEARSVMKGLRMEALGCLRGVRIVLRGHADEQTFAKYEEQRQWIIEEILSSLVKLPDQSVQARYQYVKSRKRGDC